MIIKNGVGKVVPFIVADILREASFDNGYTSLVICETDKKDISLSQHASGDWDISVNGDPYEEYDTEDGEKAVKDFMN